MWGLRRGERAAAGFGAGVTAALAGAAFGAGATAAPASASIVSFAGFDVPPPVRTTILPVIAPAGTTRSTRVGETTVGVTGCVTPRNVTVVSGAKPAPSMSSRPPTAIDAGARHLLITHFSPRYDDPSPLLTEAREVFPDTTAARDLMEIEIGRD